MGGGRHAVMALGKRAVIQRGWTGLSIALLPPGTVPELARYAARHCCFVDDVDHAHLFPKCDAIVCHGGASTVTAAWASKRPVFVAPVAFDQSWWGRRVEQLGTGCLLPGVRDVQRHDFSAAMDGADKHVPWCEAVGALLESERVAMGGVAAKRVHEHIAKNRRVAGAPPSSGTTWTAFYGPGTETIASIADRHFGTEFRRVDGPSSAFASVVWVLQNCGEGMDARVHQAVVASVLDNTELLSVKSDLGLLAAQMTCAMLQTVAFQGVDEFAEWASSAFSYGAVKAGAPQMWIVKDALENSGQGLWIVSGSNWREVAGRVKQRLGTSRGVDLIAQEYVQQPALWDGGFKYHLRVYTVLTAVGEVFVYRKAFAHIANKPYTPAFQPSCGGFESEIHITNVASNARNGQHPSCT